MQIIDLPPRFDGHPEHDHRGSGQEEVYVVLRGSGVVEINGELIAIDPETLVRVGPESRRKIYAGPLRRRLPIPEVVQLVARGRKLRPTDHPASRSVIRRRSRSRPWRRAACRRGRTRRRRRAARAARRSRRQETYRTWGPLPRAWNFPSHRSVETASYARPGVAVREATCP
jgi:hypothetical protein